jgi:hypothetical protein
MCSSSTVAEGDLRWKRVACVGTPAPDLRLYDRSLAALCTNDAMTCSDQGAPSQGGTTRRGRGRGAERLLCPLADASLSPATRAPPVQPHACAPSIVAYTSVCAHSFVMSACLMHYQWFRDMEGPLLARYGGSFYMGGNVYDMIFSPAMFFYKFGTLPRAIGSHTPPTHTHQAQLVPKA